jgi:hypothetical protein
VVRESPLQGGRSGSDRALGSNKTRRADWHFKRGIVLLPNRRRAGPAKPRKLLGLLFRRLATNAEQRDQCLARPLPPGSLHMDCRISDREWSRTWASAARRSVGASASVTTGVPTAGACRSRRSVSTGASGASCRAARQHVAEAVAVEKERHHRQTVLHGRRPLLRRGRGAHRHASAHRHRQREKEERLSFKPYRAARERDGHLERRPPSVKREAEEE